MVASTHTLDAEPHVIAPAVFDITEAAAYLKTPTPTLYTLAQNGRIPAVKVGRCWRFPKAMLDDWLTARATRRMGK